MRQNKVDIKKTVIITVEKVLAVSIKLIKLTIDAGIRDSKIR